MSRRDEVLDLAITVLERDGAATFGLGAVARAGGVSTPSLYKHVDGIDGLTAALADRLFARFDEAMGADGRATIAEVIAGFRRVVAEQPQTYLFVSTRPLPRARLTPGREWAAMAHLVGALGEDESHHPRARAAWAWAHGLTVLQLDERFPEGSQLDEEWALLVTTVEAWASGFVVESGPVMP